MGIPIAELQARVSSREFAEYWALYQLDPWGPERDDLRAGIVASTVANVNRDRRKRPRPYTPQEFMPKLVEATADAEETVDPAEIARRVSEVMRGLGGRSPEPAEDA